VDTGESRAGNVETPGVAPVAMMAISKSSASPLANSTRVEAVEPGGVVGDELDSVVG
jgi:hypothetical protein